MSAHPETAAFAEALLLGAPEDHHALLWTLQDKRSHWVPLRDNGAAAVAERASRLAADEMDVYISVSLSAVSGGPHRRIAAADSAGIMGLWADVDIAAPDVHKKWNLPPDEKSALALLERAGVEPSLIVHSGHGLQAWWLFDEAWLFDSEQDRGAAADLAQRWNTTLRVRAAENGWTVDSVFDLSRVMRVPGTFNRKGTPVVPVRTIATSAKRYGHEDFDAFMVDDTALARLGLSPVRTYVVEGLELADAAQPHFEKFEALLSNSDLFKASWERKRRDLKDQSGSSYDLSIASLAAQAGWSDQEIADLIVAHRRKHRDDVSKALRQDYMARTIAKARDGHAREAAAEHTEDVVYALKAAQASEDHEEVKGARRKALDTIGQQLGVEVVHFIKYTSEPPTYRMITPTQEVDLGDVTGILEWRKFHASVAAATDHMIDRMKQPTWDRLAQAILHSCEHQDVGMESTEKGQVYVWLSEYLMARQPVTDQADAILTEYPFTDGSGTHIFGSAFRRWLWLARGEKVSNREIGKLLRLYGCTPLKINVTTETGAKTTRSAWTLPGDPR